MCGIAGIFAYHYAANPIDRPELLRIRDDMTARGPDGAGAWYAEDGCVGLGHRRLSIIDLSDGGLQPMVSADGRYVIVFNGEIYNYRALRRTLEKHGCLFSSQSDTEVLLHLYARKGAAMLHDLRGMFAIAIWDRDARSLFLARDPYGIKPLYYADDGWTLRFASQVKALMAGGRISRDPDPAGWTGFYLFGSVPEPYTTFRQISSLPAGTHMTVNRIGASAPVRYHAIAQTYCDAEQRTPEAASDVRDALLDSVRHHLVADVPVGAFLSAGIDSGALVGLMRDAGHSDIQTVTLAFAEFEDRPEDEAPLAAHVARHYGTRHTTRIVTEQEFTGDLPRILTAMDQPSIDGINTWFISKAAKELGLKVAISGLGGDELFGGYASFSSIPRWVRWIGAPSHIPFLGRLARQTIRAMSPALPAINPKAAGIIELGGTYPGAYLLRRGLFMPWELDAILPREMAQEGLRRLRPLAHTAAALSPEPRTPFARIATLESALYMRNQLLRDTDWASMAHGLEVRVPLVDAALLTRIAPVMVRQKGDRRAKHMLAAAPRQPLPSDVLDRPKTGFSTPIAGWLATASTGLRPYADVPSLAADQCPWARRWAYGVATA